MRRSTTPCSTEYFFYVAWATGDQIDMARAIEPPLTRLAFKVLGGGRDDRDLADNALGAAISVTRWLDRYDPNRAAALAVLLGQFEDSDQYPEQPRFRVALLLSGPPGRHTSMFPSERARRTLERYRHLLAGHERLALLGSDLGGRASDAMSRFDELLEAADDYTAFMADHSPVDRLYDRGRLFSQVGGLVRTLAVAGNVRPALQLLGRWYGVERVREDLVLLLAADPEGARWITERRIEPEPSDAATLAPVIAAGNRALGLFITHLDALDEGLPDYVCRPGIPNHEAADEYEALCEQHLRLDGLAAQAAAGASGAVVMVPGLPLPLCALARRRLNTGWPMAVSLSAPLADRPLRRAAIWVSNIAVGDGETEAVSALLEASGIEVERFRTELTVERFISLYSRQDLDVLWVACHGEHTVFEPERSQLTVGVEQELTLEDMLALPAPEAAGRRLLVLNACDSGTAAQFGGLADFGIGAVLAGPSQAVVGHQWPIGLLEAAGFGAVLAAGLADGEGFVEAFDRAAAALERGVTETLHELEGRDARGELRARLEVRRERRHDLLDWGSPIFLE